MPARVRQRGWLILAQVRQRGRLILAHVRRRWRQGGRFRPAAVLLAAALAGMGIGSLLAGTIAARLPAADSPRVQCANEELYDACYDQGYHRGWTEGYDQGYQEGRDNPSSPAHALTFEEARGRPGRAALSTAIGLAQGYAPSREYEAGRYDCNDMALELWSAFRAGSVASCMVVGNTKMEDESFAQSDHCWVVVFCTDDATGEEVTLAVDPQVSLIGVVEGPGSPSGGSPSQVPAPGDPDAPLGAQYLEGFFYNDPAGLREDLGTRW